MAAAVKMIQCL